MGQTVHMRDSMAMEDHADEIDRGLIPPAGYLLPTGPSLAAFQHIMDGWGRGAGARPKADGSGAAYGHALAHEAHAGPGLRRGNQVTGAEPVDDSPPPPTAQFGKILQ